LKYCEHEPFAVLCLVHEMIMCTECQLESHLSCKLKSIKQGAIEQISKMEEILNNSREHLQSCQQMQQRVQS